MAPNRAFNYLIDIVRGLCFSENLGVPAILKLTCTDLCMRKVTKLAKQPKPFVGLNIGFLNIYGCPQKPFQINASPDA